MYAAYVHMGLGVEANVHSTPEDSAMGHQKWSSETLKDMEMNVSVTRDPLYDAALVAREKRVIEEETLWAIETAFEAVGVIHCQINAM
jgi:hypothetical protein